MSRLLLNKQLLTGASAQDAAGSIGQSHGGKAESTKFYVRFGAATSAGTVAIEEASDVNYTGTWAPITTLAWSAVTKESSYNLVGTFRAVRARISVAVVGGTVDCWAQVSG